MAPAAYNAYSSAEVNKGAIMSSSESQLTLSLSDLEQANLHRAAQLAGLSVEEFVRNLIAESAGDPMSIYESDPPLVLTERESIQLMEVLENPPPPTEKFLEAQAAYRRIFTNARSSAS
jgi:uncharacterized protein (DUF1778 family)